MIALDIPQPESGTARSLEEAINNVKAKLAKEKWLRS